MELFTPNFILSVSFLCQNYRTKSPSPVLMNIHNLGEIKVNNHILNLIVLQLHEILQEDSNFSKNKETKCILDKIRMIR